MCGGRAAHQVSGSSSSRGRHALEHGTRCGEAARAANCVHGRGQRDASAAVRRKRSAAACFRPSRPSRPAPGGPRHGTPSVDWHPWRPPPARCRRTAERFACASPPRGGSPACLRGGAGTTLATAGLGSRVAGGPASLSRGARRPLVAQGDTADEDAGRSGRAARRSACTGSTEDGARGRKPLGSSGCSSRAPAGAKQPRPGRSPGASAGRKPGGRLSNCRCGPPPAGGRTHPGGAGAPRAPEPAVVEVEGADRGGGHIPGRQPLRYRLRAPRDSVSVASSGSRQCGRHRPHWTSGRRAAARRRPRRGTAGKGRCGHP